MKALYRLGIEFCDEVERLAPQTRPFRPFRPADLDLTAATLSVKAQRLRGALGRMFAAERWTDEATAVENDVRDLMVRVEGWRAAHAGSALDAACQLVHERGALFVTLYHRQRDADTAASSAF